jgi:GT2 family glycosyltransferase
VYRVKIVNYSSGLSVDLTNRRGPRDIGAFGFANDDLVVFADASGWSCCMRYSIVKSVGSQISN